MLRRCTQQAAFLFAAGLRSALIGDGLFNVVVVVGVLLTKQIPLLKTARMAGAWQLVCLHRLAECLLCSESRVMLIAFVL